MAEKKGVGHAYNVDFLNVVFAASSVFLFLSVVWMVWDDYDRDWKNTQRRFAQLEYEVTQAQLAAGGRGGRPEQAAAAEAQQQAAAAEKVAANQQKVDELRGQDGGSRQRPVPRHARLPDYLKATYDQDRYDFEASRVAGGCRARRRRAQAVAELEQRVDRAEPGDARRRPPRRPRSRSELGELHRRRPPPSQKQIDELHAEQTRLRKRLDVIAPSVVKDYFRNAPLLDFMAPTLKVQQIILPNVVDDVNFIRVPKMDRCQTCHLAIDKKGYEKYPQPFTTHPNLETYLGGSIAASDRQGRLHRLPRRAWGSRSASSTRRTRRRTSSRRRSGRRSTTGKSRTCGTTRCCRRSMTEASCAKCHKQQVYRAQGREAERRLRDLRARRLLRVPQDEGLRHRTSGSRGRS